MINRRNFLGRTVGAGAGLVLAPDLLEIFPDSESVNEALRTLVRLTSAAPARMSAKTAAAPRARKKAGS